MATQSVRLQSGSCPSTVPNAGQERNRVTTIPDAPLPVSNAIAETPIWNGVTSSQQNHRLRQPSPDVLILETANGMLRDGLLMIAVLAPIAGYFAEWFGLPLIGVIGVAMIFGWGGICLLGVHFYAKSNGTRAEFDRGHGKWFFRHAFPPDELRRSLADIVAVQVISYIVRENWIFGDTWLERMLSSRLCQINLVCRCPKDGSIERIKLITNTGRKVLPEMAAEIAEFLQVPLYRVENQILDVRTHRNASRGDLHG
jgi:hypothetical protein